ncbi:MAG: hypothetical protein PWQ10_47 [Patescibacteria group bacterium]|nr:hypothetical protein [Patescibacteria group bacterium]
MDIIIFFACFINLLLGAFVLLHDPKSIHSRLFMFMSVSICIWIISSYITDMRMSSIVINIISNRLAYVSGYLVILSGTIFTYFFPVKRKISLKRLLLFSVFNILVLCLAASKLVSGYVNINSLGNLEFSIGPLLWSYIVGILVLIILIIKNLLRPSLHIDKNNKIQAHLVLLSFCFGALSGLLLNVIIPILIGNWHTAQFGSLSTIVFISIIVYAITRHGLFDIRLALVRTSAYVLSLSTFIVVYYLLAYTLSILILGSETAFNKQNGLSIIIALVLASFFQPVKKLFDRLTSAVFYRDNYDSDIFFSNINRIATLTTNIGDLLKSSTNEIAETVKIEQVFFVVLRDEGGFISTGTSHHSRLPASDIKVLGNYTRNNGNRLLDRRTLSDDDNIFRRLMISHKIELVLPLVISDKLIGYLCLGDKKSGRFTSRDINVLKTASDELAIAIQNALAVQEIRELNETLQQKVSNATKELRASNAILRQLDKNKDEFVSMASHQLRTPLTSVKGYISMVLEGDAGKISESQRNLLSEAFISSERMVRLINDFLNVSRLQTGKFVIDKHPVDLSKLVEQEIDSLKSNATVRNMKFNYRKPKDFPIIKVDEDKIRQVVMNFADNAIYYSHDGTAIDINLVVKGNEVIFTVKDTGIGVPSKEQEQLFSKFYRASNARKQRPDGTGVGLFLAKKVVSVHGGKVIFKSVENKGSTFGFSLPIE